MGAELPKISFANISVTSKDKELLDYIEILRRALDPSIGTRRTVSAAYQFIDVACEQLGTGIESLCFYGRILKDTTILREQVYENGQLLQRRLELPSSPSAFFVFNLLDHRMALMPETQGAPSITTFGNTLRYFMHKAHEDEIRRQYKAAAETGDTVTLKSLRENLPQPIVDIVPIADKVAISAFLADFEKITQVVVKVTRRNQDLKHGELFDELAEEVAPLGPSNSRFIISGGRDGLDREKTSDFVKEVVDHGYEDTTITGLDRTGAKIKGSNEDYSLVRYIDEVPENNRSRAESVYEQYVSAKAAGQIKVGDRSSHEKLEQIAALQNQNG